MGNVFKILIGAGVVFAVVFYWVVTQQQQHDVQMQMEDAKFDQIWNEFERDFTKRPEAKAEYQRRADEAAAEFAELKKKERERAARLEKFEHEFERALSDERQ